MTGADQRLTKPLQLHIRVTPALKRDVERMARRIHQPLSGTAGVLLQEAVANRRLRAEQQDMNVHLLIAIEQVIALIESFHPRGTGAADEVLGRAAIAARARISGSNDDDSA